jgi:hypothetical protein
MISLDNALCLGKGNERICYLHPNDETKVIKISYKKVSSREQNNLEFVYYQALERKRVNFSHITYCYGWVTTNEGQGLVFDYVRNFDKSVIFSLHDVLREKLLSCDYVDQLLMELHDYLQENRIIFADISFTNILCQKINEREFKLIIIDGLGSRRFGFKFWLTMQNSWYALYRTINQWKKVINVYKSYEN